jgi:pyruvate/2-oxoacid:ferredoxin oxidoreductase beta subunit
MNRKLVVGAAATGITVAVALAGAAAAVASNDDGDHTVAGRQAARATAAALAATEGGTANSVERDSENGATWEVEVTKPDGTTVDVRLDQTYQVVVIEGDGDASREG